MTFTIQQRRQAVMSHVYQLGHVSVSRLAEELSVSEATVRRDLHSLATEGLLELAHGGASVVRNSDYSFISKSMRNIEAKRAIAAMASELIADGEQIFLDSGTTCFEITPFLRKKRGLSVIVNSIRTAQELYAPTLKVLILGGQYRPDRMDTVGPMATEAMDRLRGYCAFLGTDGLGMDFGLTSIDIESAHLFGLAARNARQVILLADHSKFRNPSLYKIADFDCLRAVITDRQPSEQWCDYLARKNITIVFPGVTPAQKLKITGS
ncbi:MAG: DeoR/GlpR family DNA-binding transcription regulator [Planctomycetales bacterium]|nr:DeoR/GlpR family DNA-binding transcription regulator [Planctomycetales bacterium]